MPTAQEILKQYFGYDSFRPGQDELVQAILSGRDTLGIMPTGAGKSICYQVPALALPGLTLVISPLISLMKDQVGALNEAGVPAACINSALSFEEMRDALYFAGRGEYKLLYVAPERLTAPFFLDFARRVPISMVTVDEAHCISQWGQDFRPSYLKILDFLAALPQRPLVSAFTATATAEVRDDIIRALGLEDPFVITTGFDRPNLYFAVEKPSSKPSALLAHLLQRRDKSGIVYCSTRKTVEEVCDMLLSRGLPATRYHAGLDPEERLANQDDFLYDRKTIMVATNAFGMGIDKSNVRYVLHHNMPASIEAYYQEAGRAGRDGLPSECLLFWSEKDLSTCRFFIEQESANEELSPEEAEAVRQTRRRMLAAMEGYCVTCGCLREYLLRYFGEEVAAGGPAKCGNCGNCEGGFERIDVTGEARAVMRCGPISACSTRMRRSFCASGCSRARWMNFTRRCARTTARRSWPIPLARGGTTARSARWCSSCTESCRRSRTWTAGSRRRSSFGTICRRAWRIRSTGRCCFLWCGARRSTVPHCCAARRRR